MLETKKAVGKIKFTLANGEKLRRTFYNLNELYAMNSYFLEYGFYKIQNEDGTKVKYIKIEEFEVEFY